jgi:nucleoside-diphosphate-sugar epimerase
VVGAIIAAMERGTPGEIYNAVDDEPVTQLAFFTWLAGGVNRPLPPRVVADEGVWRKRGTTNKRVGNTKLHTRLEYHFKFPNFRTGYAPQCPYISKP